MRIAAGNELSDDEDDDVEDDETYYNGFRVSTGGPELKLRNVPHNPFKMGTKLRQHLEADHSPNGGGGGIDTEFEDDEEYGKNTGGRLFSVFHRFTQSRKKTQNRKYTAIVSTIFSFNIVE